jgi:thiosulfate reductase cytochrome b subunit
VAAAIVQSQPGALSVRVERHRLWVRLCHWVVALCFVTLAITGFLILMVHPRLYWGEVGNDLVPALIELPISNNHQPEGWQPAVVFTELPNTPISANRTYGLFNENSWGRSLHFLAGWLFVVGGAFYAFAAIVTGHLKRDLLPRARDLNPRALWQDLKRHLHLRSPASVEPYGLLQRCAYVSVVFIALPLMVVTGLAMSPAVTAAYPFLSDLFGGHQSARTVHFFGFAALVMFFVVHVAMVVLTGLRRQLRAMILGS